MTKLLNKTVSTKIIKFILAAALLLSLVFLLRIAFYAVPWYDDYSYTQETKYYLETYGKGPISAVKGAISTTKGMWWAWQGTFSSIFLMALCPLAFGESLYWIGPVFLILILTVSEIAFGHTLARRVFSMDRDSSWCMGLSMAILSVWRLYSANSGFYWYNAGVHYVAMHSFMLLFAVVLICLCDKKSAADTTLKIIISMILALMCSGANSVTALQGLLAVIPIALFAFFVKKRKPFVFIPATVMYIIGFYYSVTAYGNTRRAAFFTGTSNSAIMAIIKSFGKALGFLWEFTGVFTIVFIVLLAPIIWKGLNKVTYKFRLPGILVVLAFSFYATSFTPTLYAIGDSDIGRVLNAAKLTYQIMLVLSEIYVIGWIKAKVSDTSREIGYVWLYAAGLLVLAALFAVSPMERIGYTPYGAYYYVHTGEAEAYHNGYLDMVREIKSQGADVKVVRNVFKPAYLYAGELSEDPAYEPNAFMARWYGKNSISVIADEEYYD